MRSELITSLNEHITMIDTVAIETHIENGDLDKFLMKWREEMAGISFSLFTLMEVSNDRCKMV